MAIGALAPGVTPDRVLPTARSAALQLVVVESADLQVVSGQAWIVVRFAADDPETAGQVAQHVATMTATTSVVTSWRLTERGGSHWNLVRTAP